MPEITDAEFRQFVRYQSLGTVEEIEDQRKKIRKLEDDNKGYRDKIRELEAGQLPENTVAIPKERADLLEAYEKLGKPDELATVVSERDELRQREAARAREDAFRAAVKANGWPEDTVATLLDMKTLDGATVELRTEMVDGKEVEVPYITLAGDDAKPQKLAEFAASAPQLKGLRTEAPKQEHGTPYPKQPASGSAPKPPDAVQAYIQRMQEQAAARTNPLLPQSKTT